MSQQAFEVITADALLGKVRALCQAGYRLVQIGATRSAEHIELTYSFDLNRQLTNLRLQLPATEPHVPSISSIYACVVLYENEIHDLFNIHVDGMAVDFHGNLYKTSVKFPFGTVKSPAAKPAATPHAAAPTAPVAAPSK